MINWKKNSVAIFIIFFSLCATAQQFTYRANLDSIKVSGFYAINISPELSAHLNTDGSDFRVVDNKGQWIPHIIRYPKAEKISEPRVINLTFNPNRDRASSIFIIENKDKNLIGDFILRLKNAAAERMTSLSGSYDNQSWFIIADSLLLSNAGTYTKDENVKSISFPPTSYNYYKLTIRNDSKDPLNIVSISSTVVPQVETTPEIVQNPLPQFNQKDSAKLTLITIKNSKAYQFDQIELEVRRPTYYDRLVRIYLNVKPGIMDTWESQPIDEFTISSLVGFRRSLPLVKAKEFYILILNQDNPALEVTGVKTYQRLKQVITYLEKGNSYHIMLDNPKAIRPDYDLEHFHSNIPRQPTVLHVGQLVASSEVASVGMQKPSGWWIWVAIAGITILLAYLTWGLTRDMNKRNEVV